MHKLCLFQTAGVVSVWHTKVVLSKHTHEHLKHVVGYVA